MVRILFLILGFLLLGMGVVGLLLPGLPATPFLLLSSYLFARSSPKLHRWLIGTAFYQQHLETYVKTKTMTIRTKRYILFSATVFIAIAFLASATIWVKIILIVVLCIKYYIFIFHIETRT